VAGHDPRLTVGEGSASLDRPPTVPVHGPHPPGEPTLSRVLLFTGKGGVGKTSVAAATAVRAARNGQRVLVTSTDPAHSLADALDQPLGDGPTPVAVDGRAVGPDGAAPAHPGSLHAQQIDAQERLERHWREVRDYLVALLSRGGVGDVHAEELVLLPGLDELFALIDLRGQVGSGRYDLVVVDCAPTGETLRLLALPEALRWYVDRVLGPGRRLARAVRPLTRSRSSDPEDGGRVPVPDDEVFRGLERVHRDLAAVHELLQDPSRSTVRLVVNAERLVVAETERTATSLSLFGYAIDAVVVNRLLPDAVTDPYLAAWKTRQADHLATIRSSFAATPVLTAPLFADELDGVPGLASLAEVVYGDTDPSAVLADGAPLEVVAVSPGEHLLRLALPFTGRDDVDVHRRGGDLHLKVAGVARVVALPAALRRSDVAGARFRRGRLEIRFVASEGVDPDAPPAGHRAVAASEPT
jgi:arsenite/tail-anchored protein-transporting ATPase